MPKHPTNKFERLKINEEKKKRKERVGKVRREHETSEDQEKVDGHGILGIPG